MYIFFTILGICWDKFHRKEKKNMNPKRNTHPGCRGGCCWAGVGRRGWLSVLWAARWSGSPAWAAGRWTPRTPVGPSSVHPPHPSWKGRWLFAGHAWPGAEWLQVSAKHYLLKEASPDSPDQIRPPHSPLIFPSQSLLKHGIVFHSLNHVIFPHRARALKILQNGSS